jgi:hypothetical protein
LCDLDETIKRGLVKGSLGATQKPKVPVATKNETSNIKLTTQKVESAGKEKKKCC